MMRLGDQASHLQELRNKNQDLQQLNRRQNLSSRTKFSLPKHKRRNMALFNAMHKESSTTSWKKAAGRPRDL